MQKPDSVQKQKMIRNFLTYSLLFAIVKLIIERGEPKQGWGNLILTSVIFGLIMVLFYWFRESRKKPE